MAIEQTFARTGKQISRTQQARHKRPSLLKTWIAAKPHGYACRNVLEKPRGLRIHSLAIDQLDQQPGGLSYANLFSSSTPEGRNIVVAIDHTEASWKAVCWALQNVYKQGDTLHLINVIPQGFANVQQPTTGLYGPPEDGDVSQLVESSRDYLHRAFLATAQDIGVPRFEIDLVHGRCRESIGAAVCKKAAQLEASMVVVSGHKPSVWEELFMGSFSRHVAQHCQQPTVILH